MGGEGSPKSTFPGLPAVSQHYRQQQDGAKPEDLCSGAIHPQAVVCEISRARRNWLLGVMPRFSFDPGPRAWQPKQA